MDEQSRKKSDGEKAVHTPDPSESTNSKGTQTDDTPCVKEQDVDGVTGGDDKDVEGGSVKLANEGVDGDGFVKTTCVGGVPDEQDNMDLYEP